MCRAEENYAAASGHTPHAPDLHSASRFSTALARMPCPLLNPATQCQPTRAWAHLVCLHILLHTHLFCLIVLLHAHLVCLHVLLRNTRCLPLEHRAVEAAHAHDARVVAVESDVHDMACMAPVQAACMWLCMHIHVHGHACMYMCALVCTCTRTCARTFVCMMACMRYGILGHVRVSDVCSCLCMGQCICMDVRGRAHACMRQLTDLPSNPRPPAAHSPWKHLNALKGASSHTTG